MTAVPEPIARAVAEHDFSGVIRVDVGGDVDAGWAAAYGLASRRFGVANRVETPFAIASGTKSFTAVTVMSLIEQGLLGLATTARSVLADDLPLIDDDVTIEHLLTHRSGIGDYFDEAAGYTATDYVMPVPVHRLDSTPAYLQVLDGYPQQTEPGERFAYCNSGYVVLALIAERAAGRPFADLVRERICEPAGLADTGFARGDAPPPMAAEGSELIDGEWRINTLHLPVLGSGDGGLFTTAADMSTFWSALFAGRLVSADGVRTLITARSEVPSENRRYGMGFWLHRRTGVVMLEGADTGISFRSVHDPVSRRTVTTLSNTSSGAWPVTAAAEQHYGLD